LKNTQFVELRLLQYLEFPNAWGELGMYPAELANLQLEAVLRKLGCGVEEFLLLPSGSTIGLGSEHFRAAAISHWLSRRRTAKETENLKHLLSLEPDEPMARAYLRQLRSSTS
jgi:hypothetical protein